jgi:GNAT superfamily N-acetyltransferase
VHRGSQERSDDFDAMAEQQDPRNRHLVDSGPKASVLVAVERDMILAVGSVADTGEITLNYVSPDARFRGVSRALLGALEARAIQRGNLRCVLTSTETARRFYHASGYVEDGPVAGKFGTCASYPMSKPLVAVENS